ncbi:hypothetical protein EIN_047130 [Entamoeba invadens IP1]|uniref:Uncharacterized protein n=1 Tax=Entamoeba invadens IP1 TaxID=370355 RepID=A0A0A1UH20_ENTIV|nr:hypothetical protein EIN_047130 [Entamoeba invadens IP1]ELP94430.1 hypothetical protein EIN_047130 [Entamoeba invadens IP1]|eukprot:XP_004261201.1 hypothetical protein EIN_047130 [Entamoeba invadens IP1]
MEEVLSLLIQQRNLNSHHEIALAEKNFENKKITEENEMLKKEKSEIEQKLHEEMTQKENQTKEIEDLQEEIKQVKEKLVESEEKYINEQQTLQQENVMPQEIDTSEQIKEIERLHAEISELQATITTYKNKLAEKDQTIENEISRRCDSEMKKWKDTVTIKNEVILKQNNDKIELERLHKAALKEMEDKYKFEKEEMITQHRTETTKLEETISVLTKTQTQQNITNKKIKDEQNALKKLVLLYETEIKKLAIIELKDKKEIMYVNTLIPKSHLQETQQSAFEDSTSIPIVLPRFLSAVNPFKEFTRKTSVASFVLFKGDIVMRDILGFTVLNRTRKELTTQIPYCDKGSFVTSCLSKDGKMLFYCMKTDEGNVFRFFDIEKRSLIKIEGSTNTNVIKCCALDTTKYIYMSSNNYYIVNTAQVENTSTTTTMVNNLVFLMTLNDRVIYVVKKLTSYTLVFADLSKGLNSPSLSIPLEMGVDFDDFFECFNGFFVREKSVIHCVDLNETFKTKQLSVINSIDLDKQEMFKSSDVFATSKKHRILCVGGTRGDLLFWNVDYQEKMNMVKVFNVDPFVYFAC